MAKGHTRFPDHFGSTTYTPVNEPADAGSTGGGSGNREPLVNEVEQAKKAWERPTRRRSSSSREEEAPRATGSGVARMA
jgi:hypothetical protein